LEQGWRSDLLGQPIRDLVEGRAALAFEPGRGLVLEERIIATEGADVSSRVE
jgi:hypothetical protein